jgi:hypothetical protein
MLSFVNEQHPVRCECEKSVLICDFSVANRAAPLFWSPLSLGMNCLQNYIFSISDPLYFLFLDWNQVSKAPSFYESDFQKKTYLISTAEKLPCQFKELGGGTQDPLDNRSADPPLLPSDNN